MNHTSVWIAIIGLGIGTFLIRFSFLGLIGNRKLPDWVLRHLRYVPVAVLPGLVAPLVVWPAATDGAFDIPRGVAALAALAVGVSFNSVIGSAIGGFAALFLMIYLG